MDVLLPLLEERQLGTVKLTISRRYRGVSILRGRADEQQRMWAARSVPFDSRNVCAANVIVFNVIFTG